MLVVNQLMGVYDYNSDVLRTYHEDCLELLQEFKMVSIEHIPKMHNEEANTQAASDDKPITTLELSANDWRKEIICYPKNPSQKVSRQQIYKATKYVLLEDDLYYRTIDGVLLRCLGVEDSKVLMGEIHEGVCGAHQSAYKMKWMIRRTWSNNLVILEGFLSIIKVVKTARNLVIFRGSIHRL